MVFLVISWLLRSTSSEELEELASQNQTVVEVHRTDSVTAD